MSLSTETEYSIISLTGQTLLSGHITDAIQQIDVSGLDSGMYFVRIQNGNEVIAKKVNIFK